MTSALEAALMQAIRAADLPEPVREYIIPQTGRKWRFDAAWPEHSLAVECQGGIWANGRHTRGAGYSEDCVKLNEAQLVGWIVLFVTAEQIADGRAVEWIRKGLEL